jgi:hypothetical protein
MSGRPRYPWSEGDALYADELNAAIANAGSGEPVFDGVTRGYQGTTVDLTALSPAGAAIGDGVTDASPAFTAAAALPGDAAVIIPAGRYLLNGAKHFLFAHRLNMVGAGRDCVTIVFPPSTTITAVSFQFYGGGRVSGITVDLANVVQPSAGPIGIFYANTNRFDFTDNAVINGSATAYIYPVMLVNQTSGFSISDNIFSFAAPSLLSGNGAIAIQSGGVGSVSANGKISDNLFTNGGISVDATDTVVSGNSFNNWGIQGAAIYIPGDSAGVHKRNVVANNVIVGRTVALAAGDVLAGMEIGTPDTLIFGNTLSQCPGDGIDFFGPNTVIVGNTIVGAGRTGGGNGAVGIAARATASVRPTGGIIEGNTVRDDGSNTLTYGFGDEPYNAGAGTGVNTTTQTCTTQIGNNNFSGTLGPMAVRSNETYTTIFSGNAARGGTAGGTANAQTIAATVPPIIGTTLVAGLTVSFVPVANNTGATTLSVKTAVPTAVTDLLNVATKTTGAIAINKVSGGSLVPLVGGELLAAVPTTVTYNGTVWIWGPR